MRDMEQKTRERRKWTKGELLSMTLWAPEAESCWGTREPIQNTHFSSPSRAE